MPFKYYSHLTASQRRVYDKSDEVTSVVIPKASELYPLVHEIEEALLREDKGEIEIFCQQLILIAGLRSAGRLLTLVILKKKRGSKIEPFFLFFFFSEKLKRYSRL